MRRRWKVSPRTGSVQRHLARRLSYYYYCFRLLVRLFFDVVEVHIEAVAEKGNKSIIMGMLSSSRPIVKLERSQMATRI